MQGIANTFGIELESHDFCKLNPVNPMETSRPGIFVSGALQGPIDIPEAVFSASGAGSQIGELLDYRRGNLSKPCPMLFMLKSSSFHVRVIVPKK